jgi:transposase
MSKSRRKYDVDFKKNSVELFKKSGKQLCDVANELGIRYDLLSRWVREYDQHNEKAFPGQGNPVEKELYELRKKLKNAEEERDILKKALAIFSKE